MKEYSITAIKTAEWDKYERKIMHSIPAGIYISTRFHGPTMLPLFIKSVVEDDPDRPGSVIIHHYCEKPGSKNPDVIE
jgi:hypothetical protein